MDSAQLQSFGISAEDTRLAQTVMQRGSFAQAAGELGLTEGRVRHRFFRTCRILEVTKEGQTIATELLRAVAAGAKS